MRQLLCNCLDLKKIVVASCVLLLSVASFGQTTTAPQQPQAKTTADDDDMESDAPMDSCHAGGKCCNNNKFIVFADFGGSTIFNPASNANLAIGSASGVTWAVSWQMAHEFKIKSKATRLFLSAGLELRNFNGLLTTDDGFGSSAYDNYHLWYAGIPVMFQVVTVKHKTGNFHDVGFYAQAATSVDFKVDMLDVYSIQGNNSWNDVGVHYTNVMLHNYVSAGVAYKTKYNTFLLGPYLGYVFTNISTDNGVTQNVFSYGARLSVLLFR